MRRSKTTAEYVCGWCRQVIDLKRIPAWNTPLVEPGDPLFPLGKAVCGPDCPDRPTGAQVYDRDRLLDGYTATWHHQERSLLDMAYAAG